jgi:phenylacetate-CoA ligase
VAAKWRATRWWGVDIGDPEIVVWGSPIELGAQDRLRGLRDKLLRTRLLPAFELSPQNLDRFITEIRRFRPRMLFGYPSSLALIAGHAEQASVPLDGLGIRVAFVTSEQLYDHQRQVIERIFGCPVANGYGGRDAGFVAHACPEGRLHISAEDIVVEILDAEGQPLPMGQTGEIVVTHLATADFPFIRYRSGDVGALDADPCPCGRGLPVLGRIEGRSTDFVVAADGTIMHGLALIYVLRDMEEIDEFKIVQESLARIRVLIVAPRPLPVPRVAEIQHQFCRRLGQGVDVRVEQVTHIPRERSGKYRYVVSHIAQPGPAAGAELNLLHQ